MIQPPTTKSTRRIPTWLKSTRYFSVLGGASLIIGLGLAPEASLSGFFGLAALLLFGVAAAAGWMQLGMQRKLPLPVIGAGPRWSPRLWQAVLLVVTVTLVVAAQSWFQGTSVIAAGDETLPNGTAWTKHVFDPWVWSGSNLGGPGALQMQLPWALLLQVVTSLRGSEGLAQRIWLTLLFAGVGLTGAIVIRSMG